MFWSSARFQKHKSANNWSSFYRPDDIPVNQPTVLKQWRELSTLKIMHCTYSLLHLTPEGRKVTAFQPALQRHSLTIMSYCSKNKNST